MTKRSAADIVFEIFNTVLMLILTFIFFYPMWFVVCASFSNNDMILQDMGMLFWPKGFNLKAYVETFKHPMVFSGFRNTVVILVASLPLNLIMTWLCGYFMASKNMLLKKPIVFLIMFTMFFGGGMIPAYLNIRDLGMLNSLWSLILPGCLSVYNAVICKSAMENVPESLYESAYIDGANDFTVLFRIVVPLIGPTTAVLLLYYGVGHWNSWFNASIYLKENELLPIQNILRSILIANDSSLQNSGALGFEGDEINEVAETIKYAIIVVATVPILCIYPFLQRYFTKGVMIGAVKG